MIHANKVQKNKEEELTMKRKRFAEEQTIGIVKETDAGAKSPSNGGYSLGADGEGGWSNASLIVRNASSHPWQSAWK